MAESDLAELSLKDKIAAREAVVGVVGLGYVGLPLALACARAGFPTIGVDLSAKQVAAIRNAGTQQGGTQQGGTSRDGGGTATAGGGAATGAWQAGAATAAATQPESLSVADVPADDVRHALDGGKLTVGTDFSALAACDIAAICVPTPLTKNHEPDLSYVESASREISSHMLVGRDGDRPALIILESTSYPGTTEEVVRPILEASGRKVGEGRVGAGEGGAGGGGRGGGGALSVAFSPERIDPANATHRIENTPKIVGGCTDACRELATAFYDQFIDEVVPVSSTQAAEMAKLLENIFRSVNIALVNEMAMLCDRMDIDIWEVVDAAATKPYGFMRFYPGPGLGGHCIPIDPFYLSWKAREHDFYTEFIELSGKVNESMPYFVVEKLARALNEQAKPLRGAKVLLLGVAYKPDVADTRESPALKVIELLEKRGAEVTYHDPHVPLVEVDGKMYEGRELTPELAASTDCALVLTNHTDIDFAMVGREAPLVLDTRSVLDGNHENVWRL